MGNGEYNNKAGVYADRRYFMQQKNKKMNLGVLTMEEYLIRRNLIRAEEAKEEQVIHKGKSEDTQAAQNEVAEAMQWGSVMELAEWLYV